ncbi:MAG TPA: GAF domain-containing protein [Anaerolineales bacterium]|nr:GAF domain-containing protein [Anaerolineales bacterium]HNA87780.1 GAF domain-containing protein [Anaerolineales bacterium]HNB34631.1 GAF domain-containing protein [Anaerolineales bacterium]HNC07347.1 GAF domain-containing protein [Anaerolineales bacterium]
MEQITQPLQDDLNANETAPRTSLGVKLTLFVIGLLFFAFILFSIITIQVSQGTLVDNLEQDLRRNNLETIALIQNKLLETRTITVNLASAVQSGRYNDAELQKLLTDLLAQNDQIYGVTVGYEPNQFRPNLFYWAPYFNRTPGGSFAFSQLGDYDYFNQEWYFLPKRALSPTLTPPYRRAERGNIWIVTWSVPIYDDNGRFKGVAAVDVDFTKIQEKFVDLNFGATTGYAFLLDQNGTILGIGDTRRTYTPMIDSMFAISNSSVAVGWQDMTVDMTNGQTGFLEAMDIYGNPQFIAYGPIGMDTGWSLGVVYPREEIQQQTRQIQITLTAFGFVMAIILGLITFYFTRSITTPLRQLTQAAEEISSGNLLVTAPTDSLDEVGSLGETFNRMTEQLRDMLGNLERRIAERTVDLEFSRRQTEVRANQLLTIGEISKLINYEQELHVLLPYITRLVSDRFGFYHIGIFLIDDARQFAHLQAANSIGGQAMLQRGHKLRVGESGIVGYVAQTGLPRIALDVGQDAVFFNNPDLPTTRSEMALPLKIREKIIGVLDVQSNQSGAFTDEDAGTLSILADQVAIAIENTRLLEQTQQALNETRAIYQQNIREGWKNFGQEEGIVGYYHGMSSGKKLTQPMNFEELNQATNRGEVLILHADGKTQEPILVVPIKLREQIIGVIHIKAPSQDRQWTTNEINLTEAISERLSLALENARLIQESQRQVIKEQTISEITGRIGSSINLENVLLTAVEELGHTIPGSEVVIKLRKENSNGNES